MGRVTKYKKISVLGVYFPDLSFRRSANLIARQIKARKSKRQIRKKMKEAGQVNFWGRLDRTVGEELQAFLVVTPNPEICMAAAADPEYKKLLNEADLALPDGTGILWAAHYLKLPSTGAVNAKLQRWISLLWGFLRPGSIRDIIPERITGVDMTLELCRRAEREKWSVFLLGAAEGVAEQAAAKLQEKYPKLKIAGTYSGSPRPEDERAIHFEVKKGTPDILLVAYGAPAQERWLRRNLKYLPSVKCAMGVGGTLDFLAGRRARAPKWLQNLGLEWVWRLCHEPGRWRRIWTAVVKFPQTVERYKVNQNKK